MSDQKKNFSESNSSFSKELKTPDFSATSLQALNTLTPMLNSRLTLQMMKILQSKQLSKSLIARTFTKLVLRKARKYFKIWNQAALKAKRFKEGLKKLEKQDKKKKKSGNQIELGQINKEKSVNKIRNFAKRKISEIIEIVLRDLSKSLLKAEQAENFSRFKQKIWVFKILSSWKQYSRGRKTAKKKVLMRLGSCLKRVTGFYFDFLLGNSRKISFNRKIMIFSLQKILFSRNKETFKAVLSGFSSRFVLKLRYLLEAVSRYHFYYLNLAFRTLQQSQLAISNLSSLQSFIVLNKLTLKSSSKLFRSIVLPPNSRKSLNLSLALTKLNLLTLSLSKQILARIKNSEFLKFYSYSLSVIFKTVQKSLENAKRTLLTALKSHKNAIRYSKSFQLMSSFFYSKQIYFKKLFVKLLKNNNETKKHLLMLWKIKLYQIEGLIQHKKESLKLKQKFKHFCHWKKTADKISKLSKKLLKKNTIRLFTILSFMLKKKSSEIALFSFTLIKFRYLQEKSNLSSLFRIFKKMLKFQFFFKFKNAILNYTLTPTKLKNKNFFSSSLKNSLDPNKAEPRLSTQVRLFPPKRYAFYSTKKCSIDKPVSVCQEKPRAVPSYLDPQVLSKKPNLEELKKSSKK